MKTININGKEYTENEFNNQVDSEDIFFEGFHNCEDAEDLKQFIFQGLRDEFPRQQPEPPTLRPMSELLESQTFNFVAEIERKDNGYKFHECMERNGYLVQGSHRDFTFFKTDNYENEDFKILGWLYVLPKLNEIKPC